MEKDIKNWEAITEGINSYAQRKYKKEKRKGAEIKYLKQQQPRFKNNNE